MRTPSYGSHSSLCLFTFVHTSLKKAPAAVVAVKDHLSFPTYPHPSLSTASDSLPCRQPEQGQTSSTPSLTHLCGRSKLCQAVLGAAGNVENAERNPEGADAAELQGCRIWARTLHVSLSLTPQSVLVCDNGPRNGTESSVPSSLGRDIVHLDLWHEESRMDTSSAHLAETHLCTRGTFATPIVLQSPKYLFSCLC